jgi:hypothetical protein
VQLDRGRIELVTRDAFAHALPEIAIPSLPFIGAYGVTVKSLDAIEVILRKGGMTFRRTDDCLITPFPEPLGHGAWLFPADNRASLLA